VLDALLKKIGHTDSVEMQRCLKRLAACIPGSDEYNRNAWLEAHFAKREEESPRLRDRHRFEEWVRIMLAFEEGTYRICSHCNRPTFREGIANDPKPVLCSACMASVKASPVQ
jgi:hypothetical protein